MNCLLIFLMFFKKFNEKYYFFKKFKKNFVFCNFLNIFKFKFGIILCVNCVMEYIGSF